MKGLFIILFLLLMGASAGAQTKPVSSTASPASTPSSIVLVVEGVTGKRFLPDTAFAALSEEDENLLSKVPLANWDLVQASSKNVSYSNLVIGTRSYQLLIMHIPKDEFPTATLMRYTTPKSKPEPIARGMLKPKGEEKPK